jgi:hypothetical protein
MGQLVVCLSVALLISLLYSASLTNRMQKPSLEIPVQRSRPEGFARNVQSPKGLSAPAATSYHLPFPPDSCTVLVSNPRYYSNLAAYSSEQFGAAKKQVLCENSTVKLLIPILTPLLPLAT